MSRRRSNRHGSRSKQSERRGPRSHFRVCRSAIRPSSAHNKRGVGLANGPAFDAPEDWHEPTDLKGVRCVVHEPGNGFVHAVTPAQVLNRIEQLPDRYRACVQVVQFSRMTKKRRLFPCYGMQWGSAVYLYPIEASLVEVYVRPPRPQQLVEARMFGGRWKQDGDRWLLEWTEASIRDYYLNNVLIHEIGHIHDDRNSGFAARERYADWFAIEFGYRASRGLNNRYDCGNSRTVRGPR